MSPVLTGVPRLIFTVFEPITLAVGFFTALLSVDSFIADQYPYRGVIQSYLPHTPNAKVLAWQLGNLYGLMGLIAFLVLRQTQERSTVRTMITCLAMADVGHVGSCFYVMGWDRFIDVARWNAMAWGNIGITILLFASRISYLFGAFEARPKTKVR